MCHWTSCLTLSRLWNHSGPQFPQLSDSTPPLPTSRSVARSHKVIFVKSSENYISKLKTTLQPFNTDKIISRATGFILLSNFFSLVPIAHNIWSINCYYLKTPTITIMFSTPPTITTIFSLPLWLTQRLAKFTVSLSNVSMWIHFYCVHLKYLLDCVKLVFHTSVFWYYNDN